MRAEEKITPFPYSGNKLVVSRKLLATVAPIMKAAISANCIIEPFAGSAAFSLTVRSAIDEYNKSTGKNLPVPHILLTDSSRHLINCWNFVASATRNRIMELNDLVVANNNGKCTDLSDVVTDEELSFIKLTCCGVYRGQFVSTKITNCERSGGLGEDRILTAKRLLELEKVRVWNIDCETLVERHLDKALKYYDKVLLFVDPPYVGTLANYDKHGYMEGTQQSLRKLLIKAKKLKIPTVITYGDTDLFKNDLNWKEIAMRKVPRIRCGGTLVRYDYYATLNIEE